MREQKESLTEFLEEISESKDPVSGRLTRQAGGAPIGIWLPADLKARYDKLQEKSGRRFGKKAREALIALIELAEARTA